MEKSAAQWRPVTRARAHEQVLRAIEEQIASGNLRRGDRLPSERELADLLKVSRPSVREALRVLEWIGVVVAGVGSGQSAGSIITGRPGDALSRMFGIHLALAGFSMDDVIGTRVALERTAVEAAAGAAGQDFAPLHGLVDQMRQAREPAEFMEIDTNFHLAIAAVSGNMLLKEVMQALRNVVHQVMTEAFDRLPDWRLAAEQLSEEHAAIVSAIERGDGEEAAVLVGRHINEFYRAMVNARPR